VTTRELTNININEFLTVEESAKFLGIKESAVRNYLSLGRLITYKVKSLTLLKVDDLKNWKSRKQRR
jgi:excisionase family DNA binding protein